MYGLIVKDFRIITERKQTLVLFAAISFMLGLAGKEAFMLGYLPFLIVALCVSTTAYDEMDHGLSFLMTLPINAKTYVREKYLFCIIGGALATGVAVLLLFLLHGMQGQTLMASSDLEYLKTFLPLMLMAIAFIIPVQLKFGAEKSKLVYGIVFGAVAAIVLLIGKNEEAIMWIDSLVESMGSLSQYLELIFIGIGVAILFISYLITLHVMKNKEL